MPEQKQAEKAPIHGGDDDIVDEPPPSKPKLTKYASKPDQNIRDIFWDIMGLYATKNEIQHELFKKHYNSRIGIVKIAVGTLSNPENDHYGLSSNFTALYTLMLLLDQDWEDAFMEFLSDTYDVKKRPILSVMVAINKLTENSKYKEKLITYLGKMIRDRYMTECATGYITEIHHKEIIEKLKKELLILARSDIEQNQYNAINALTLIRDDEEVEGTLISLLNHWDEETRRMVAMILNEKTNEKIIEAAKRREKIENNEYIKKILKAMVNKGEKDGNNKNT